VDTRTRRTRDVPDGCAGFNRREEQRDGPEGRWRRVGAEQHHDGGTRFDAPPADQQGPGAAALSRGQGDGVAGVQGSSRIGTMDVHRPALEGRQSRVLMVDRQATDEGDELEYPENFYTGNWEIFSDERRGGTLLIDASRSNNWDWRALAQALVHRFPALRIGIYSGTDGHGVLTVIADKGRIATVDSHPQLPGNEVDIPALRWLAAGSEPRVWLSDGNAIGGALSRVLPAAAIDRVTTLAVRFHIVRASQITAAIRLLDTKNAARGRDIFRPRQVGFLPELESRVARGIGAYNRPLNGQDVG
jgi:hypothetical protein